MPARKADLELVRHVAEDPVGPLGAELARWVASRPRFRAFVGTHRDKFRKKVRTARADGAAASVRAELLTAYLVLADNRFEIAAEAFGAGNTGPDLTVTFREGYRFNIEVTRRQGVTGLTAAVAKKLRQLPPGMANVLVIGVPAGTPDSEVAALRSLTVGAAGREIQRLSAVFTLDAAGGVASWSNPGARHPLAADAGRALGRCLAAAATPASDTSADV